MLDRVNRGMHRTREFLATDLWTLDTRRFSLRGRAALNTLKVIYIVCRGFIHDRCALQAASLTFMTLMCLVPLLALVLLVARALQFDQALQTWLQTSAHQHVPSHIQPLLTQILELVKTTNLLALGSVGCLLILALLIRVMTRIEHTLNAVWGVREGRRLTRRLPEYLSIFFIVPFLLLLATSVNTMLASDAITDWLQGALARILPDADEVAVQSNYPFWVAYFTIYELILRVVGWCGLVGGLLFLYLWMPNTNVKFRSALIGAVCATVMWLLWQRFCINFQFWVSKYNAIYGAFASLPIALLWLNTNWMIVLLGAEISFATQNCSTYVLEQEAHTVSYALRRRLAFRIVLEICQCFHHGYAPWRESAFQTARHVPVRLLHSVLYTLKDNQIVTETADGGWAPARRPGQITLADVELSMTGSLEGKFSHLGELPEVLVPFFREQHETYMQQLGNHNYDELLRMLDEHEVEPRCGTASDADAPAADGNA